MKQLSNKGFTLVETLIAASLVSSFLIGIFYYFQNQNKEISKSQQAIEKTLDGLTFEDRIRKDFFETKYSFNTLLQKDDKNQLFFDYLPNGKCSLNCQRTIALKKPQKAETFSGEIYFLLKDKSNSVEQVIKPEDAYTYSSSFSNDDSNMSFTSINKNNNLSLRENTPWSLVDPNKPRLILLYTPQYVYPPNAVIGQTPGRLIQFLGWLNSTSINGSLLPELIKTPKENIFNNVDPRDNSKISNEDLMLKHIPYRSGSGVYVMVAPVMVVRMRIKAVSEGGKIIGKLYRDVLINKNKYEEMVLASNVEQLSFFRESISSSLINLKITYGK